MYECWFYGVVTEKRTQLIPASEVHETTNNNSEQSGKTVRELVVFTAVTIWGSELCNKQILIYCDNETVVTVINSGKCKNNRIMDVVRGIFFVCARNNISLFAEHVRGVENEMADALSRLQEERFARLHPTARKTSTPVPRSAWTI